MKYSVGVHTRKQKGRVTYDGFLHYYDEDGKRKTVHRERTTMSAAREAIRIELSKLEDSGPKALTPTIVTFSDLADYFEREIYVAAEYNDAGEKLLGVRDLSTYKAHLKRFKEFFRGKKLADITVGDLTRYRSHRLRSTRRGPDNTQVNIRPGTVAREFNTLRAMLYEAKRNRWIKESPFEFVRKNEVYRASDYKPRTKFLTFDQEIRLLKACETEDRRHLRALIITAVDTGARRGELINLTKSQLDFSGQGTIRGMVNYKGLGGDAQHRDAKMTPRVREALLDVINNPPEKAAFKTLRSGAKPSADLVFGVTRTVKKAWKNALRDAGLAGSDLHFHDLRHTPGTRVKKMIDLVDIQKALGHRDPKTTAGIYIEHTDDDLVEFAQAVQRAVEAGYQQAALSALSEETKPDQESSLVS